LPEDAAVATNGTDLIQILLNLALNALQCTPQYHRVEIRGQVLSQPLDLDMFADGPERSIHQPRRFQERCSSALCRFRTMDRESGPR
jgi:signal transduction histidine kinase